MEININEINQREVRKGYYDELDALIKNTEAGSYTGANVPALELKATQVQTAKKYVSKRDHSLKETAKGASEGMKIVYLAAAIEKATASTETAAEPEAEKVPAKSKSRAKATAKA